MLREGMKLARKIGNTAPLSDAVTSEVSPGPAVQSDDDWDAWIANTIGTEFHPSCSCAMLPLEQGGVVDSTLKVYGLGKRSHIWSLTIQFTYHNCDSECPCCRRLRLPHTICGSCMSSPKIVVSSHSRK